MKPRLVDILLMVGLFLVGAAILWTLFTLGNDRSQPVTPGDDPPAAATPADPDAAGDVLPVAPGEDGPAGAGDGPADDGAGAADDADADAEPAESQADADEEADVVAREPIVEGQPVPLERVGFSFTTGGTGACGVVLEPWEHVAVSRELLAAYGCGTEITIELADEIAGRTEVSLVVADTMNEQFTRTANIYVAPDEPAIEYGVTDGTLVP